MTWKQTLDRAYSLALLDALEPAVVAEQLAAELPAASSLADFEARDALFGYVLAQIDVVASRAMKLRLEHGLAGDTSIGPPTRNVFSATIVAYATKLPLLAERARDVAMRGGAAAPDQIAERVVDAARSVFALRDGLCAGVLELLRSVAAAAITSADHHARDRSLTEAERRRWSALRRDLEALAAEPTHVRTPLATRLAALPDQIDEPDPEPEVSFADMIELD